jgi:hypothetical protein
MIDVGVPPSGVRVRCLLELPPCNVRRRVMRCNAQATQAISEILIQVQIQLVHVSVGCAVTGEDQLRKLDCAEVERCGATRNAVIKNVTRDVKRQTSITN